MVPEESKSPQKKTSGYGKRPVWQWAVIYLVVAAIVYWLIWYFLIRKTGGSVGGY